MTRPIIHFSDLHCNKYNQFSEHRDRLKDCLKVIDDVFKYAIAYESNTITFGGDMGDLPKWIYIEVIDDILLRLAKWFKKCPHITMYAISGNHDHNKKNYWDKPAKTLLNVLATAFPGRFILIDNKVVSIGDDCYIAGIPYYEHSACYNQALDVMHESCLFPNDDKAKVTLLIHQTPEGIYNKHIKADTNPSDSRYDVFDLVLCGHIHQSQRITDKFVLAGNPLHRDLGDIGNEKGIWLFDARSPVKTLEFISRKGRYPEFVRMKPEDITEEVKKNSFAIPTMDAKAIKVAGSADVRKFASNLQPQVLLKNFWEQTEGTDERLLAIGLELCEQ